MIKKIKKINNQKRLADIKKKLRLSKLTKTNIATKSNPKLSKSTSSSQVAKKNNKILKNDTAKVINFKNKKKKLKSKSKLNFDDDTKTDKHFPCSGLNKVHQQNIRSNSPHIRILWIQGFDA